MRMRASRVAQARIPSRPCGSLLYFDHRFKVNAAKLLPGEYLVSDGELMLVTTLGSCVSACIWDDRNGIGGMNHFLLPQQGSADVASESARYGGFAMELLINGLLKAGALRAELQAKVFGGGAVLASMTHSRVGARNAQFVREYLAHEGIPIVAEDLEGDRPRKLHFFPRIGRVFVHTLPAAQQGEVLATETDYQARLSQEPVAGDVELFA